MDLCADLCILCIRRSEKVVRASYSMNASVLRIIHFCQWIYIIGPADMTDDIEFAVRAKSINISCYTIFNITSTFRMLTKCKIYKNTGYIFYKTNLKTVLIRISSNTCSSQTVVEHSSGAAKFANETRKLFKKKEAPLTNTKIFSAKRNYLIGCQLRS